VSFVWAAAGSVYPEHEAYGAGIYDENAIQDISQVHGGALHRRGTE